MDLAQLDTSPAANAGEKMELRGPNQAPVLKADNTPVTITLLGQDSDTFIKTKNAQGNRFLKQRGKATVTMEGSEADGVALLAKCTVGWDGIVVDGAELPCTYENAVALYNRFKFIREQADEFVAERANFLKG